MGLQIAPEEQAFDVAFIDADKLSYPKYWTELVPRVRSGGLIMLPIGDGLTVALKHY
jgi:caffeoyl-CoA O-methyltransferase